MTDTLDTDTTEISLDNKYKITIFTGDEGARLTKKYRLDDKGKIAKVGTPNFWEGVAKTKPLDNLSDLAATIDNLKDNQCIATGVFDISPCKIVTKEGIDNENFKNGTRARAKEYMIQPSSGIALLDYDPSKYMPNNMICHTVKDVINYIKMACPLFKDIGFIGRESVSSGIYKSGQEPPKYNKGFHVYFFLKDIPLSALKEYLEIKLWNEGVGYIAFARNGSMLTKTIVDLSVFSPERLIYEAPPIIGPGLSRKELRWTKIEGGPLVGDLSLTEEEKKEFMKCVGDARNNYENQAKSNELSEIYNNTQAAELAKLKGITLDEAKKAWVPLSNMNNVLPKTFVIDLGEKKITVEELLANGKEYDNITMPDPIEGIAYGPEKARFYYNKGKNPCIHSFAHGGQIFFFEGFGNEFKESNAEEFEVIPDPAKVLPESTVGVSCGKGVSELKEVIMETENSLSREVVSSVSIKDEEDWAIDIAEEMLKKVGEDRGAAFEKNVLNALKIIHKNSPDYYQRIMDWIKEQNPGVQITELKNLTKVSAKERKISGSTDANTHHGYAKGLIKGLTVDSWKPVGNGGFLWIFNKQNGLWDGLEFDKIVTEVANRYDNRDFCHTRGDYKGITEHVLSLANNSSFFEDAPFGLATSSGFHRIVNKQVVCEPLKPEHRQRVMLPVTPRQMPLPLFQQFLDDTFAADNAEEHDQQISLLQEVIGMIILGRMYKYQKAILFYDAIGRSGKGVMVKIIKSLVPKDFTASLNPFKWDQEYYLAALAGKKLNVVGELDESKPIPANQFKSVIGEDDLSGRNPAEKVQNFRNEAAHVFSSNYLINTNDFSEAFYGRWIIFHFPNSLYRVKKSMDETLADRIIQQELPGIAQWALDGAIRRLDKNEFSPSIVHDRIMGEWRKGGNSLMFFIEDCCDIGDPEFSVRRSDFYKEYADWCKECRAKIYTKSEVKSFLTNNLNLGITLHEKGAYELFKGIRLKNFEPY